MTSTWVHPATINMETFPFVPRKLKQKATATTPQIQHIPTPSALLEPVLGFGSGSQDLNAEKKVVASNSSISKVKGKQKETTDVSLCSTLVSLALSDYNIWNDENLRSKLNGSDDGCKHDPIHPQQTQLTNILSHTNQFPPQHLANPRRASPDTVST